MDDDFITVLRQNHALEHATIAVLMNKVGPNVRLIGQATPNGFYIYGNVPTEDIGKAATEGLARLQRGERELAVSPLCGTNISIAGIMAAMACFFAFRGKHRARRLPVAILAATWAIMAAQPIGRAVQKHVTTSSDLSSVTIKRVMKLSSGNRILHKIETTRGSEAG